MQEEKRPITLSYTIQYEPSKPDGPGEVRAVTFEDIVIEVNYGY